MSQGVGADLSHYAQSNAGHDGAEPLIPLGTSGKLALDGRELEWQVVGYQERCDVPADSDDEQTFWREYLLFNRQEGFVFLVDSEDGWSWVKPLTGAPQVRGERGDLERQDLPAARALRGQGHLGAGRVLLARAARRNGSRHRLRGHRQRHRSGGCRASAARPSSPGPRAPCWTLRPSRAHSGWRRPPPRRCSAALRGAPATLDGGLLKVGLIVAVVVVVLMIGFCSSRDRDCGDVRATFGEASNEYQQCLRSSGRRHGLSHRRRLVRRLQQRRRAQVKATRRRD